MTTTTRARVRPPINQSLLLDAALRLIEQDGLEGMSMRRLGEKFNVQAASLYWYFRSKDELLDLLADGLYGSAATHLQQRGYGTLDPDAHLRAALSDHRAFLIRHVHLAEVFGRTRPTGSGYAMLVGTLIDPVGQLLPTAHPERLGQVVALLLDYVHGAVRTQQAPSSGGGSMVQSIKELGVNLKESGLAKESALAKGLHSDFVDRFQLGLAALTIGLQQAVSG